MRFHSLRVGAALLTGAAMCAPSAQAQFSFQRNSITNISVSSNGVGVLAVGDLTNDARDDIIAVDADNDRFWVYINDGTGNFLNSPTEFGTGSGPVAATIGDFDGDGDLDVATANEGADTITAYLGDGTGNFVDPRDYNVDPGPVALVAVDLNNDRKDDLAVLTDQTVYLLKSNGDGTFSPFAPASVRTRGDGSASIVAGMFDNNSNWDLAAALMGSNQVAVFLGGGDGTFQSAALQNVGTEPEGIVVAELRTRGTFDIAAVDTQDTDLNVSLLFNDGSGGFEPSVPTTADTDSVGIAAGDFDKDGKVDLAVTTKRGGQSVAFLRNDPDAQGQENGFVLLNRGVSVGTFATAIRTANLNGDGYPDLVVLGLDTNEDPTVIGALVNTSFQTPSPTTPPLTATPTPPPTGAVTPGGPSPTPAPTDTPAATNTVPPTPTATPIPTIPYTLCNTPIGGRPVGVAAGRLTDETPFIAVADDSGNRLVILTANINANTNVACTLLGLQRRADVPGVIGPRAVISETVDLTGDRLPLDLDRDGKTDLAVVGSAGLSIFFGDGNGGFSASPVNPLPAGNPFSVGSTDYNRDGLPDLVVADSGGNGVSIFLGTGGRSLNPACPVTVGRHTSLIVGQDLNGDGRPDFVAGSDQTNDLSVFLQAVPTGTPTPIASCAQLSSAFRGLTPLDLGARPTALVVDIFEFSNRVPDLAVALSPQGGEGSVNLFYGRSMGTDVVYQLQPSLSVPRPTPIPPTPTGPSRPSAMGSGDVNGDGREDLIITDSVNGTLVVFLAGADGRFGASLIPQQVEQPIGANPPAPAALTVVDRPDIDGDGKPDIVVANAGDGSISIFVSRIQPATPTPRSTDTPTRTATPTITPTLTPTRTPTPEPTASPSVTASPTPSRTRPPTPVPTPTFKPGTFNLGSCAIQPSAGGPLVEPMTLAVLLWVVCRRSVARGRHFRQD